MTREWDLLSSYNQIRRRTEMYFGSRDPHTQMVLSYGKDGPCLIETTWVPAIYTCFREILDNALDEVITHGRGDRIDVTYEPDTLTFMVADNGKGLPIEWSEEHQAYAATVLLSALHSGRNFKEERGEARGLNGIGAKGVNFCSEWFQVEANRGGTRFEQRFREGEELVIEDPIILPGTRKSGTRVRFKLSEKVFPQSGLPEPFVAARMHEIALCYPKLHLTYNGRRIQIKDVGAALFGEQKPIMFDVAESGFASKFWMLPQTTLEDDTTFSICNGIPLFNGGTHIDAFRRGFYTGLLGALERENKRRKLTPNRADVSAGLLVYNLTTMTGPSFDSQAKTRLINEHVGGHIRKALDDPDLFRRIIRENPQWIDTIYSRCRSRTSSKEEKDTAKQGRKNLRQKIEALKDACGHDRSKCILFLAEGDSAISGLLKARNPELHGGLPLRGKVLNVFAETNKKIIENEALSKIMNSIGLIPGQRANRHALRYGKVYLTCDADPDGANIAALLVNFFHSCWPELFDPAKPPYVHIFNTPLIIAVKGKQRRYWYAEDYAGFAPDKYKGWEITRAKGLAALVKEDWKHVLDNPRAVPIVDDGKLRDALTLLFDQSKADRRKEWIGL